MERLEERGKYKTLIQFFIQKMMCDPIDPITLPRNTVVLQPYWKYVVKRSRVR